jgi:hypothetical protein
MVEHEAPLQSCLDPRSRRTGRERDRAGSSCAATTAEMSDAWAALRARDMPIANISSFEDFAHAVVETTASLLETRQLHNRGAGDVTWRWTSGVRLRPPPIGRGLTFAVRGAGAAPRCALDCRAAVTLPQRGTRRSSTRPTIPERGSTATRVMDRRCIVQITKALRIHSLTRRRVAIRGRARGPPHRARVRQCSV